MKRERNCNGGHLGTFIYWEVVKLDLHKYLSNWGRLGMPKTGTEYPKKMSSMPQTYRSDADIFFIQISTFRRPLLILGALICLSVYVNRAAWEHLTTWQYLAFAALPVTMLALFLLRKRMFIKFGDDRLTVHYFNGTERSYDWRDITKVGIVSFKRPMPSVVLRLRDDSTSLTAQSKIYRAVSGYDVVLPAFCAPAKYLYARIEQTRLSKGAPIS